MSAPPTSTTEAQRLAALQQYAILDTPAEAIFDELAQLAAQICGTPIALVSLVDAERQWFKARVGMAQPETPRHVAFCDQAIQQPKELLVVPDALQDPRFATSTLVTEAPNIRFYAGTPLVSPEGQALGTLCVMDRIPRELTPNQKHALWVLGRQVMAQMELRHKMGIVLRHEEHLEQLVAMRTVELTEANAQREALIVDLQHLVTERQQAERLYQRLFDGAPIMYVITRNQNGQPHIVDCNSEFLSRLGYTRAEVLERPLADFYTPASHATLLREGYQRALAGEFVDDQRELVTRTGQVIATVLRALPEVDEAGAVNGTRAMFVDITERLRAEEQLQQLNAQLEQRVTERTAALERLNKELEAFNYSVSHDLRAPLRSIAGFSQALQEDYGGQLDAEAQDYLTRMRLATSRMSEMIDGLLALSRLSRYPMQLERVDLSVLARAIVSDLQGAQPDREVKAHIAPDMQAYGDPRLLRELLQNLLSNAWKYTSHHPTAQIEFGVCATAVSPQTFFVRDDGAGFDPAYADKLFGVFQRLHRAIDFPGTGVGLATVQRIVQRHGGRIWAEAQVEHGATFYFTLNERESVS